MKSKSGGILASGTGDTDIVGGRADCSVLQQWEYWGRLSAENLRMQA